MRAKVMRLMAGASAKSRLQRLPQSAGEAATQKQWRHWLDPRLQPWAAAQNLEWRTAVRQWCPGAKTVELGTFNQQFRALVYELMGMLDDEPMFLRVARLGQNRWAQEPPQESYLSREGTS